MSAVLPHQRRGNLLCPNRPNQTRSRSPRPCWRAGRSCWRPAPGKSRWASARRPTRSGTWPAGPPGCSTLNGNQHLTRPVIMADGFNSGPSTLDFSWTGLELGDYPMISELRRRGRDAIVLGFPERSASILDNARVARDGHSPGHRAAPGQSAAGRRRIQHGRPRHSVRPGQAGIPANGPPDGALLVLRQPAPRRLDPDRPPGLRALHPRPQRQLLQPDQQPRRPAVTVAAHRGVGQRARGEQATERTSSPRSSEWAVGRSYRG